MSTIRHAYVGRHRLTTAGHTDTTAAYARFIGRVGALAVALGVGAAVATNLGLPTAHADDATQNQNQTTGDAAEVTTPKQDSEHQAETKPSNPPQVTVNGEAVGNGAASNHPKADPLTPPKMNLESSGGYHKEDEHGGNALKNDAVITRTDDAKSATTKLASPDDEIATETKSQSVIRTPAPSNRSTPSGSQERQAPLSKSIDSSPQLAQESVVAQSKAKVDNEIRSLSLPSPASDTASRKAPEKITLAEVQPDPPAAPAANPAETLGALLAVPGTLLNTAAALTATILTTLLSPPSPQTPAPPLTLWAVLAWVRKEFQNSFANQTPTAVKDTASTSEGDPVTIDVVHNDIDTDGNALTVDSFTQPTNGTVTRNVDGTLRYTPNTEFNGTDTFTYTVTDETSGAHIHGLFGLFGGGGHTSTATVTVTVNDDPEAVDDIAVTAAGTPKVIAVLSNDSDGDGDPLTVSAVTQAAHGSVTTNGTTVTYTPNAGYVGSDSFTYTASDGRGGTDTATVAVAVVQGGPEVLATVNLEGNPVGNLVVGKTGLIYQMTSGAYGTRLNIIDPADPGHPTFVPISGSVGVYNEGNFAVGEDGTAYVLTYSTRNLDDATVSLIVVDPAAPNSPTIAVVPGNYYYDQAVIGSDGTVYVVTHDTPSHGTDIHVTVIDPTDIAGRTTYDIPNDNFWNGNRLKIADDGPLYITSQTRDDRTYNYDYHVTVVDRTGATTIDLPGSTYQYDHVVLSPGGIGYVTTTSQGTNYAYTTHVTVIDPQNLAATTTVDIPGNTYDPYYDYSDRTVVDSDGVAYVVTYVQGDSGPRTPSVTVIDPTDPSTANTIALPANAGNIRVTTSSDGTAFVSYSHYVDSTSINQVVVFDPENPDQTTFVIVPGESWDSTQRVATTADGVAYISSYDYRYTESGKLEYTTYVTVVDPTDPGHPVTITLPGNYVSGHPIVAGPNGPVYKTTESYDTSTNLINVQQLTVIDPSDLGHPTTIDLPDVGSSQTVVGTDGTGYFGTYDYETRRYHLTIVDPKDPAHPTVIELAGSAYDGLALGPDGTVYQMTSEYDDETNTGSTHVTIIGRGTPNVDV